jgi:hypothetical protein
MNDHHHHDGSHRWLLLIPATMLMAKAMRRGRRHDGGRHRAWMAGPGFDRTGSEGASASGFRLPPKIESVLNAWHEQAHRAATPSESGSAASDA